VPSPALLRLKFCCVVFIIVFEDLAVLALSVFPLYLSKPLVPKLSAFDFASPLISRLLPLALVTVPTRNTQVGLLMGSATR